MAQLGFRILIVVLAATNIFGCGAILVLAPEVARGDRLRIAADVLRSEIGGSPAQPTSAITASTSTPTRIAAATSTPAALPRTVTPVPPTPTATPGLRPSTTPSAGRPPLPGQPGGTPTASPSPPPPTPPAVVLSPPPGWPDSKQTGVPVVDRVIAAIRADALVSVAGSFQAPCIAPPTGITPAGVVRQWCLPGEPVGTNVSWFFTGGTEGQYRRADTVRPLLEGWRTAGGRLFSVHEARPEERELGAQYVVVFAVPKHPNDEQHASVFYVNAAGLCAIFNYEPIRLMTNATNFLLPPPQ